MKIVLVEWVDSCGDSRWHDIKIARESKISNCWSIGVLLNEDDKRIIVVPNGDPSVGNVLNEMAIPKVAITRMRILKVVK